MKTLFLNLKMSFLFFQLVKDPTQTEQIFLLSDLSRTQNFPLLVPTLEYIKSQDGVLALFHEGYNPPLPTLEELLNFPEGTLGKNFGRHMNDNGLTINFFPTAQGHSELDYIVNRARKMHDLWHVLFGFDVRVPGEVGLQAFTLAQIRSPFSAMLIAGGLLHVLHRKPQLFIETIEQMFSGYQQGLLYPPLLGIKLESLLTRNQEELLKELKYLRTHHDRAEEFRMSPPPSSLVLW